jgi:hypothetical protein
VCRGGTIVVIVVRERQVAEDIIDIEKEVVVGEEIIGVHVGEEASFSYGS